MGSILVLGGSPGEGDSYPLQYSCLGNPMDRGAWWATVHQVTKHWTQLSISSVQFNRSVVSNSLRPHGLQHARPPCPSPTLQGLAHTHVHQVGDAIQPSHPLLSTSPPAFNPSQHQCLFK